ncbi:MAG TPA: glycosyltransferase family 1 protein [Desulfobulbus sp.]|nr:glycosyltransferase family 1 protein [Desulfobulbus sp.]
MRVIVDVSVIGLAGLYETARTGIYRVISSLVPELLAMEELDLRVTSLSSTEINRLTRDYFRGLGFAGRYVGVNSLEERLFDLALRMGPVDPLKICQRAVARMFRQWRINRVGEAADIFHSTFSPLPEFGRRPLCFMTIYDIIPVLHPEYFWQGFDHDFKKILGAIRVEEDWVITISRSSRDDICNYLGMDPDRVFIACPAASPALYHPRADGEAVRSVLARYGIPAAGYFLSLATLEYRKNLQATIAAFRKLLAEPGQGEYRLVLVGTRGWKIDRLLDEILRDPGLKDRVIFTGYVADEDLSALYGGALAFVYPSLYEGFGLPPLEAMQCGLPVITSNTSSLPEVVGDAGIMVDPEDTDALAGAMLRVGEDAGLRRRMREKGLARAARFSWSRCARETAAAYRAAMAAGR